MPGDTEGEPPQTKSKSAIFLTRLKTILSAGIITSFILGVAIGALFFLPFRNDKDTVFTIETGSPLPLIAKRLKNEGLISNQYVFRLGVILFGNAAQLKAGEFSLSSRSSMYRVMHVLTEGKAVLHSVTIPEGLSNVQIHNLLAKTPLLIGDITSMPPEGSLLPETYHFPRGGSRDALILQMENAMRQTLDQLWDNRAPNLPLQNQDEALVLASIVEKETGVAAERALVASVFINRLNKNMRLQSDPTIIYGLKKGQVLGRPIRKSELKKPTAYNTYIIRGLPPTPIANPGRHALAATLNPAKTDYLYFVADGTGGHVFAKTLSAHNKNVENWRRMRSRQ
ncbi:MAG: endolytic transglycosylase MltG [Pseudomonadota bacterium]|nr:endolytic transglycosylase MltG [Pseudomonadota bacterium]